jgi:hypothetical protein
MENRMMDSQAVYNDMYEKLKSMDIKSITKMHDRLNDTMMLAFRISKNYFFAFLFYIGSSLYLIAKSIVPEFTIIGLLLMNFCFIYKTYEFVANKFCYIDAQIVLVYKTVLDRIILNEHKRRRIDE